MDNLRPIRLRELKLQAIFLLKDFRSNSERAKAAALRFSRLPYYVSASFDTDASQAGKIKLKHAYEVIAQEYGFPDWPTLMRHVVEKDCLYRPSHIGFVHSWFKDYEEAKVYHIKNGGYLLAFWNDIIICGPEYIRGLELHPYQEYWKRINYNWLKPASLQAWKFLYDRAKENYLNQ